MEFEFRRLSNGIRTVHLPTTSGQVVHLGLTIPVGSRDEKLKEQGIAHFIEHLLFKGTKKRKAFHVLNRMDSVGAELNAYTTKEETVIYASFLKEHFARAAEVIADIAFNSTFPDKEIVKEKEVVLDEILSYRDNPSELIMDDFEEYLFPDHPMGRNILGTEETVRSFRQKDLVKFVTNHYESQRMVVSLVGPIKPDRALKTLERYFTAVMPSSSLNGVRIKPRPTQFRKEIELDTFQAHLIVGGPAYDAGHRLRLPMVLLNNILGGPAMNSKLNLNIREKYGIAYNIESIYQPYSDTGVFSVYLGTDKKWLGKSEKLIMKEFKTLRDKKLSTTALTRAKQQLKGHYALSRESGVGMMQSMGKSLLLLNDVEDSETILKRIDEISAEEVIEAANDCLNPNRMSTLIFK